MSLLENVDVKPAAPVARVVVNARTGTVVIGGDVRVTPAAVSHGSLTVKVQEQTTTAPGTTTTPVVRAARGAPPSKDDHVEGVVRRSSHRVVARAAERASPDSDAVGDDGRGAYECGRGGVG